MVGPTPIFFGRVKGGKVLLIRRDEFHNMVESLEGHDIEMTLKPRRRNRSLKQNSYIHVCLKLIADHTGYDLKEFKEVFKRYYLTEYTDDPLFPERITGIHELSREEASDVIEKLHRVAAFLGLVLPDPQETEY